MTNALNPLSSDTLLKGGKTLTNRYGTISEQPSIAREVHTQLEYGQREFTNPITGCATLFGGISSPTTLVVKNSGSTARDYFATERNYLSWLRLTTVMVLVGMSYYFRFDTTIPSEPPIPPVPVPSLPVPPPEPSPAPSYSYEFYEKAFGSFLIALGIFVLSWALFNYFQFQKRITSRRVVVEHSTLAFSVVSLVGISVFLTLIVVAFKDWFGEDKVEGEGIGVIKSFIQWIFPL